MMEFLLPIHSLDLFSFLPNQASPTTASDHGSHQDGLWQPSVVPQPVAHSKLDVPRNLLLAEPLSVRPAHTILAHIQFLVARVPLSQFRQLSPR